MRSYRDTGVRAALLALCIPPSSGAAQLTPPAGVGVESATVYLTVRDADEHAEIWREGFGVTVHPLGSARIVDIPGVLLVLASGEPTAGSDGATVDHEGFLVPDYLAVKAMFQARGFPVTLENADNKQVTFEFPDGIKFEFSGVEGLTAPIAHHHIHLFVTDAEAVRDWYARVLDAVPSTRNQFLSVIFPGDGLFEGATACRRPDGDFRCPRIDFARTGAAREMNTGRSLDRIGLEVQGLDEWVKRLRDAGIQVEIAMSDVSAPGVRRAVIVDPVGNRIELSEGLAVR